MQCLDIQIQMKETGMSIKKDLEEENKRIEIVSKLKCLKIYKQRTLKVKRKDERSERLKEC